MSFRSSLRRLVEPARKPRQTQPEDQFFQTMLKRSSDVICHIEDGRFLYVSPSAAHAFGWDPAAMVGTEALDSVHEDDRLTIATLVARLLSEEQASPTMQCRAICRDGSFKWCETTASIEVDTLSGHRGVLIMRDISDRKRIEEELSALALQDSLTGLANRRAFDQTLEREWKRTLRDGGEMALLLLDLDHFKQFNDRYGHPAGDDCLRAVAACVRHHVRRPGDVACRYGGEEIAVILGGTGSLSAMKIAESLCSSILALAIPHEQSSCSRSVTASIGVATAIARIGGTMRMPESLLQAADHALYKAKAAGRARVEQTLLIAPSGAT
jgi:diguanylate cyclase (GGDEF)-like protein/PAS domain S-box-containing protein